MNGKQKPPPPKIMEVDQKQLDELLEHAEAGQVLSEEECQLLRAAFGSLSYLCGKVFTAQVPQDVGPDKYDITVASMIGLLKYGTGMPFNRQAGLQESLGVPLPASTQWKLVAEAAPSLRPAHEELIRQAAQGDLVYNDDTTNRILERMGKRLEKAEAKKGSAAQSEKADEEKDPERCGIFTSGIVCSCAGQLIALFFTGWKHAGENLRDVLVRRAAQLGPPIQMCDALSHNLPGELKTILAHCLAHARRKFVDVVEYFGQDVRYVLKVLAVIYKNDEEARKQNLSPEARLQWHQAQSAPVMKELHQWLTRQIEDRLVEPNSGLGQAITFMLKHWSELTLFLRQAGAPLDNNVCERALKKVILHRKNAMFYLTDNGARVGDMYMSLIYTCQLCGANPFDYLTALQRHAPQVAAHPQDWMPWNYRDALALIPATAGPPATAPTDSLATVP
ncbi:MAG: IS66 family transposase [Planctomycetes bacterium]|nr:IS66 family transposase [Planctomycetota bacterium]